jgi:hypothetical protein
LLQTEIFSNIEKRLIPAYRGIHLLRRDIEDGVEFAMIMWFDTLDAVRAFAGDDYEVAVVPPEARNLLSRFDEQSAHYQVVKTPE